MKSNKRITHAYCVEANRVLPITAARQLYYALDPRKKLHFLCSTKICRDAKVKITGVNYDLLPEEQARHLEAHYRANPKDKHDKSCEWVLGDVSEDQLSGGSHEENLEPDAKRKLLDFIDDFDPSLDDSEDGDESELADDGVAPGAGLGGSQGRIYPGRVRHSTNSLERLVQCYREARETLSKDEFEALKIRVKGQGELSLQSYFRPMKWVRLGINDRVVHGGARYTKYGRGFRFDFYDSFQDKPVSLYVSPEQVDAYRYRRYWFELFKQADKVAYFKVFALGRLVERDKGDGYSFVPDDLKHLAIVLGPGKSDK
jgi:hypothetical protein